MSSDKNRYISSPTDVKHELHVSYDPRTMTLIGMPKSWSHCLNSDNSQSIRNDVDFNKSSGEESIMSSVKNRYISSPTDVKHELHVSYDPRTMTITGMPKSWSHCLNSDNSQSIRNDVDFNKSSGRKNSKALELEISYPFSVRHTLHFELDAATGELIGTDMPWQNRFNSSIIPFTTLSENGNTVLRYNDVGWKKEVPFIPSRSCDNTTVVSRRVDHQSTGYAAGNMRSDIDHTEAVYIHKQLAVLAESVGIIISPTVCGTGFRVGMDYVMTAKHVVDQIMKETPAVLTQRTLPSEERRFRNTDIYIDFAHERNGQQGDRNHRFNFEPDIIYANDSLDTVILKLKPDVKKYPPPVINFTQLSEQTHQGYFIGHPRADIKRTDRYKRVMLTPHDIITAKIWSQHQAGVDGFIGIDDPGRVLLHCSFGKGASGAPGFWICPNDGQTYVVMMLVRGYPDWYYDDKHPAAMKVVVPSNHLVEQGVPMESIYKDMKDNAYDLWEEIFCFV